MSVDCNISVQFEVRGQLLREIAVEHCSRMKVLADGSYEEREGFDRDALRMLEHASEGKGVAIGPRGDMFTWGSVGNYSSIDYFVDALAPFWIDLYAKRVMFDHHSIIVMFQQEQRPTGKTIEIIAKRVAGQVPSTIEIRELEASFPLFGWHLERRDDALPQGVLVREVEKTSFNGEDND
jgi:hypothetical protein